MFTTVVSLDPFTTSNLIEGLNLYYTKTRVDSDVNQGFVDRSTTDLVEGNNLYYTTARADSDAKNAISVTDNGGDGSLTYSAATGSITFTGPSATEVRAHFSGGTGVTISNGVISIPQPVDSAADVVFGSATIVNSLVVQGNFQVDGTQTIINTQSLSVSDNMIYLNIIESNGSPTQFIDIGFAGNYNDGGTFAHAGFFRDATDGTWKIYDGYLPDPGASVQIDIADSSFNLAALQVGSLIGKYLGFDSDFTGKSTSDLTEGSNLYYTKARVDSDVLQGFANRTTDDVTEGSNLYYTTARADSDARHAISVTDLGGDGSLSYSAATGVITYTGPSAAEVRAHFSAAGDLSYDSSTGVFSFDVEQVYTKENFDSDFNVALDEAALNGIGLSYNSITNTLSIDSVGLLNFSTDNITEGSNLYYTRERFDTALADSISISSIRGYFGSSGDLVYNESTGKFSIDVEQIYTKDNFDSDFNVALDEAALGGIGLAYNSTTNTLSIDSAELNSNFAAGTNKLGVAQFDSDQFTVTSGFTTISIIDGGSF